MKRWCDCEEWRKWYFIYWGDNEMNYCPYCGKKLNKGEVNEDTVTVS